MPSFIVAFLHVSVREHSTVFAFDFLSLALPTKLKRGECSGGIERK
jgi:hypothetical protein